MAVGAAAGPNPVVIDPLAYVAKLDEQEQLLKEFQASKSLLRDRVDQFAVDLKFVQKEIAALGDNFEGNFNGAISEKFWIFSGKHDELTKSVDELDKRVKMLETRKKGLVGADEDKPQLKAVEESLVTIKREMVDLKESSARHLRELEREDAAINDRLDDVVDAIIALDKAQTTPDGLVVKLVEGRKTLDAHTAINERIDDVEVAITAKVYEIEEAHNTLDGRVEKLIIDHNARVDAHDTLQEAHDTLNKHEKKLAEDVTKLTERHDALRDAHNELCTSYNKMKPAIIEKFKELEDEKNVLQGRVAILEADSKIAEARLVLLDHQDRQKTTEMTDLAKRVAELETRLTQANERNRKQEQKIAGLSKKLDEDIANNQVRDLDFAELKALVTRIGGTVDANGTRTAQLEETFEERGRTMNKHIVRQEKAILETETLFDQKLQEIKAQMGKFESMMKDLMRGLAGFRAEILADVAGRMEAAIAYVLKQLRGTQTERPPLSVSREVVVINPSTDSPPI